MFDIYDRGAKGFLWREDLERIMNAITDEVGVRPGTARYREACRIFDALWWFLSEEARRAGEGKDTGEVDRISRKAWVRFHSQTASDLEIYEAACLPVAKLIFDMLDSDRDDRICDEEFRRFCRMFGVSEAPAERTFREMDRNRDTYLTRGEFLNYYRQFFQSEDEDSLGNSLFGPLDAGRK